MKSTCFVKINRPTFNFLQLAVQSLSVFVIHFNDLLKGVLFLAVKLCPAPFKLGGIGAFHKAAERKYWERREQRCLTFGWRLCYSGGRMVDSWFTGHPIILQLCLVQSGVIIELAS